MKAKRLNKKALIANPSAIEAPMYKTGLFGKKRLNLKEIQDELEKVYTEMSNYGQNLVPGKNDDMFVGVAIVVLET